jgi:hypothetical protein
MYIYMYIYICIYIYVEELLFNGEWLYHVIYDDNEVEDSTRSELYDNVNVKIME